MLEKQYLKLTFILILFYYKRNISPRKPISPRKIFTFYLEFILFPFFPKPSDQVPDMTDILKPVKHRLHYLRYS